MPQQIAQRSDLISQHAHIGPQIAAGERNRQRRDSERQTFHRRRDRARIEDVLAHVLAMIDSAQHEVGPLGHQRFQLGQGLHFMQADLIIREQLFE